MDVVYKREKDNSLYISASRLFKYVSTFFLSFNIILKYRNDTFLLAYQFVKHVWKMCPLWTKTITPR
jgi:hypothetical protein